MQPKIRIWSNFFKTRYNFEKMNPMENHPIENCPNIGENDWQKKCPIIWENLAKQNNKLCSEAKLDCKSCGKTVTWASDKEEAINLIKRDKVVCFPTPGRVMKQTIDFYIGGLRGFDFESKEGKIIFLFNHI